MNYVAFFRNLNLGRKNCPSKIQFEHAFIRAGAEQSQSFLTNGTMLFSATSQSHANTILQEACKIMALECGLKEPGFVRSLNHLKILVKQDPFAEIDKESVYECCISFLSADAKPTFSLPLQTKNGNVEIIKITQGEIFSISRKLKSSPGSPNAFLEKLLVLPVTTRAWNTIVRIVNKYS